MLFRFVLVLYAGHNLFLKTPLLWQQIKYFVHLEANEITLEEKLRAFIRDFFFTVTDTDKCNNKANIHRVNWSNCQNKKKITDL